MPGADLVLFKKQEQFAKAVLSGHYNFLLYGGAIRGGKSIVTFSLLILLAKIFPGSRWAIVRRDLPTLRRNTVPTFERIRPARFVGPLNRGTWSYRCANGSEILLFPETIKHDPDLDRWKGLEVNGFVLEEANELWEAAFNKSIERAGTWTIAGEQPRPLVLLTCNPARNWVKRIFYDPYRSGILAPPFFYLPSKVKDNPHVGEVYLQSLEHMKRVDARAYKRFVEGDWDQADDPTQLIQFDWLIAARNVEPIQGKRGLGVDVARYGDDDSVLAHVDGNRLTALEYHHGLSTDRVGDLVIERMRAQSIAADAVNVDAVGIGAGVVDHCKRAGFAVREVQSGSRQLPRIVAQGESAYSFNNLRSQLWWELREALRTGAICLDVDDTRLIEDLAAPRFTVTADRVIKVESKDEIKKRIGRSTDAGDAVVYAFANLQDPTSRAWGFSW